MCLKKIRPGSFFPDQQLYTIQLVYLQNMLLVPSWIIISKHRQTHQKATVCMINGKMRAESKTIYSCPYRGHAPFPPLAVSGVGNMQMCVGVNSNPRRLCLLWKTELLTH